LNILFIVPYVPNLIRVRPYNLIRNLAARGNRVTVLTVWTSEQDRQDMEALRMLSEQVEGICVPTWRSLLNCLKGLPRSPLTVGLFLIGFAPKTGRINHRNSNRL
jgi:hypothetical protein